MITKIEVLRKGDGKRWSYNDVKITDHNGTYTVGWSDNELKREELKLKLLLAGADEKVLQGFEEVVSSIGWADGHEVGYSDGGGDMSGT